MLSDTSFKAWGDSTGGKALALHAADFGLIIRTGGLRNPWHGQEKCNWMYAGIFIKIGNKEGRRELVKI